MCLIEVFKLYLLYLKLTVLLVSLPSVFIFVVADIVLVGLQVIESTVKEFMARKFTCVEIISGRPVPNGATIEFTTEDGSAVGEPVGCGSYTPFKSK